MLKTGQSSCFFSETSNNLYYIIMGEAHFYKIFRSEGGKVIG